MENTEVSRSTGQWSVRGVEVNYGNLPLVTPHVLLHGRHVPHTPGVPVRAAGHVYMLVSLQ